MHWTVPFQLAFLLCLGMPILWGQQLSKQVSLHVSNKPMEDVLEELELQYQVSFVYSSSFVPVNRMVSYSEKNQPLEEVLQVLLSGSSIQWVEREGFIILKPDLTTKEPVTTKVEEPQPSLNELDKPFSDQEFEKRIREEQARLAALPPIQSPKFESLPGGARIAEFNIDKYRREWQLNLRPEYTIPKTPQVKAAQVSLFPMIGTNFMQSDQLTNKVSVNVFWGINGGVDGLEVGGFVNTIYEDVKGVQVAGLGNTVGGQVKGTQVGGIFNVTKGEVDGLQVAGLFNLSGTSSAVQLAGLFNLSQGKTSGVQASALFNRAEKGGDVAQAAGIFNKSGGDAKLQASLFYNKAENVRLGQYSFLFNKAREVKGVQLGLINVADTVSGVPIGLFNIIRKGYNRIEIGASETFWVNTGVKFGARRFYNIVHFGLRWDDISPEQQVETRVSWTLGYGIGTTVGLSPAWLLNVEGILQHVNELEGWTNDLNLLTRFRVTADRRLGKRISFYIGPHLSILASDRIDPETGEYHTLLTPYTFHQKSNNGRTVSMWIGFGGGLRF